VFENKGAMMGASNPHPHSQNLGDQPQANEPSRKWPQSQYLEEHASCLIRDVLKAEIESGERVVLETSISPPWCLSGQCGP
jgi:UDPglucose--hexose-1-phosphate uridylyltransferase